MKLPSYFVLLLAFCFCGCSGPKVNEVKLPSGDSIGVISIAYMHFSEGPPAMILKYQTSKAISDTTALRKQAEEVWVGFRPQVEQQGFKSAVLSANDVPKGFILKSNSTYNFVFVQNPDGTWHCLFDDKK